MKVGDLVKVKTKFYGTVLGLIIKDGMDGWFIQPTDHPRTVIASTKDVEVISDCR